ncbi:MAG TPA: hypothetical protein VLK53_12025 [Gaiellaceae bacterium]|nr:hypothetical protein [Gaiellaceae bacterium]
MSSTERQRGVDLFNEVWRLMETREDDERMVNAAHASAFHWASAPECKPENRARSEWLISRVYTVLGRGEPAVWHAQRCLEWCESTGIGDWDLAYAYEALARAHAVSGTGEADAWKAKAREAGDTIADEEDREHFEEDYATL